MTIKLTPYPTASGIQRALDADDAGFSISVKYIAVGKGLQAIQLDSAGRAVTDSLKSLVGYTEILSAERVNEYQHQLTVDLVGIQATEWNFSEFALCDADKNVIAIYGSSTQALWTVTPILDNALLGINLVLGTFPADSITIEHHNLPLEMNIVPLLAATDHFVGRTTNAMMRDYIDRRAHEVTAAQQRASADAALAEQRESFELNVQGALDGQTQLITQLSGALAALTQKDQMQVDEQAGFNHTVENAVGNLSIGLMR